MITFETRPTYKHHLYATFLTVLHTTVGKVCLVFLVLLSCGFSNIIETAFNNLWLGLLAIPCFYIIGGFSLFIIAPLISYLIATLYWKVDHIKYFFDDAEFGYTVRNSRITIKKEEIRSMEIHPNYILIRLKRGRMYFMADRDIIEKTSKKLTSSAYKQFISKGQEGKE